MDVEKMLDEYTAWLRREITVTNMGEYAEITTPFLDRFNDYFQLYVRQVNDGLLEMTDDGYLLGNLSTCGISFPQSSNNMRMLYKILRNSSLVLDGERLLCNCSLEEFPQRKHSFIQAMLNIDDYFEASSISKNSFLLDDIIKFFTENEIYYSPDIPIIGKTGSTNKYDFLFQRGKNKPERFCKVINKMREDYRNLTIFNWIDTKEVRDKDAELIVIINSNNTIKEDDLVAFRNYDIKPIKSKEIAKHKDLFAAA